MKRTLESYLEQLEKQSDKDLRSYEKSLRTAYRTLIRDMQRVISDVYTKIGDDADTMLANLNKYSRKDNVEGQLAYLINEFSKKKYKGMYNHLRDQLLFAYQFYYTGLTEVSGASYKLTPLKTEWVTSMIENEISGLTLKETLQKQRQNIIYQIKSKLIQGINQGYSYGKMANEIKEAVNGDYKKAITTARTEVHRVRNVGTQKSAEEGEKHGIKQMKTWLNMKDERSRKQHRKMHGVSIPVSEFFKLPDGATCLVPGETGRAEHDINCRCICRYSIVEEAAQNVEGKEQEKEKQEEAKQTNELDACKTVEDIEKLFKKKDWFSRYPNGERSDQDLTLKGADLEYGKAIYKRYEQFFKKYPQMKNKIRGVEVVKPNAFVGKNDYAGCFSDTGKVMVNLNYASDAKKAQKSYSEDGIYHPKGTDWQAVIIHELGHALNGYLTKMGTFGKTDVSKKLRDKVIKNCNIPLSKMRTEVSGYATKNHSEWFAEAFAEYMCSEQPRQVAQEVGRLLEEIMKEVK